MEQYRAEWYSQNTKATVDISGRCGNLTLTDDLDALALKLTLDVQQSLLDPYRAVYSLKGELALEDGKWFLSEDKDAFCHKYFGIVMTAIGKNIPDKASK